MSLFDRIRDLFRQKVTAAIDKAEDPREALELAYRRQLEQLQQVRRSVADVLTSQKRLEIEAGQLSNSEARLRTEAAGAVGRGDENEARRLLIRAGTSRVARERLERHIAEIKEQLSSLEDLVSQLASRVDAFRAQKEMARAQYTASSASVKAGEALTGLSGDMQDVGPMVERARAKLYDLQARASAVGELAERASAADTQSLGADEDRLSIATAADAELSALKRQLNP